MTTSGMLNLKSGDAKSVDVANEVQVMAADGAITIPDRGSKLVIITKGTAAAITIVAPTATVHDGVKITVVADVAAAHTVTATTIGFNKTNTSGDVGTFGVAIGNGFSFVAYQGEWITLTNVNVTLG